MDRLFMVLLFSIAAFASGIGFILGAMAHGSPSPNQARWQGVLGLTSLIAGVVSIIGFIAAWFAPEMATTILYGPAGCMVIYLIALNRLYASR